MNRILCAILILLSGCSSPEPPDNTEVKKWFERNYKALNELAALGLEHKALRRAEPKLREYTQYYGQPTSAEFKAEERVFELVHQLEIDFVAYWRNGLEENEILHSMTAPYYRWGLSLGGVSKGIVYFPNHEDKIKPSNKYHTYTYLNKKGWFIDASDTR